MKKLLIAVAAASCAVLSAQAATVSFQFGIPLVLMTTEIDVNGTLGLFNTALGTLTGATFQTFGGASFTYGGTNNSARTQNARLTATTDLIFSTSLGALNPFLATPVSLSSTSGIQAYATGQTRGFGPDSQNGGAVSDLNSILASLQANGGGNFDVNCQSLSGLTVQGGGGNIATTQATTAGCGGRITYTFTAAGSQSPGGTVPEPGSLALIGIALAGLGIVRRKSKKS